MKFEKIEDKQGQFIVIVQSELDILEVHSNGHVCSGTDDRNCLTATVHDAYANALHSQMNGLGVTLDT